MRNTPENEVVLPGVDHLKEINPSAVWMTVLSAR
jgi:hypothetical protein